MRFRDRRGYETEFNTLGELMCITAVRQWRDDHLERFSYAPSDYYDPGEDILMAEMTNGDFWVVGYIMPPGSMAADLPKWEMPSDKA